MSDKPSDAGLCVETYDGPEDKKNFKRIVELICWDATPGFVMCRDTKTGEILRVDRKKIEAAKAEAFGMQGGA